MAIFTDHPAKGTRRAFDGFLQQRQTLHESLGARWAARNVNIDGQELIPARFASAIIFAAVGMIIGLRLEDTMLILAATVGLGILGFFLGDLFYYVYVVLNGAATGYVLAGVLCGLFDWEFTFIPGSIGAIVGGALGMLFERPLGIFGTSVTGSALVTNGLAGILTRTGLHAPGRFDWGYGILFVVLIVVGCTVQSRITRNLPPRGQEGGADAKNKTKPPRPS